MQALIQKKGGETISLREQCACRVLFAVSIRVLLQKIVIMDHFKVFISGHCVMGKVKVKVIKKPSFI